MEYHCNHCEAEFREPRVEDGSVITCPECWNSDIKQIEA